MSDEPSSDAELLAAAARGDGAAFGVLVRRYIRAATLLAAQLIGDADDAEDIVQDAFTVVHRDATAFDASRPFGPWLFGIVRRLASNRRAREARRARLLRLWGWAEKGGGGGGGGPLSHPSAPLLGVDDAIIARIDAEAAVRAITALPPMQRACFELVATRGLSAGEVAAMHGIAESTVRQHVFRARAALRAVLGEDRRYD